MTGTKIQPRGLRLVADYTEKVDCWVAAHPMKPEPALLTRARDAIHRVLREESELRQLWQEADGDSWRKTVEDLLQRLTS